MICRKCPHHVRHGQVGPDAKTIQFKDRCGLRMKEKEDVACEHFPFVPPFDYMGCDIYQATFKSAGRPNDVVPTSDFQYSERLGANSLTDMELL